MGGSSGGLAAAFYRRAAKLSARWLASSPIVGSVLLRRSAATGEVRFGRSDIDLLIVESREHARDGAKLASLYRRVRRLRMINPAVRHIELFEPDGAAALARMDTFWASLERRTARLLCGPPVDIPIAPVEPDHALSRFLLWAELYFPLSLQRRNPRDLWKTALESWNAYAVADGLIQEPCLLRSEMQDQVRLTEGNILTRRLEEPDYAVRFVFELADRMHRSRLPALAPLADGLIFKAITAPLVLHRLFVVLPRADSPLPPEVFTPGVFPCTPELLHLFLHYKNAFLHWALPPRLVNLGMQPPGAGRLLRDCHYYCHHRFLCVPGFADANPAPPAARLECIRHALEWAERGELPPPLPQERMQEAAGVPSFPEYYRTAYPRLRRDSQRLQESLDRLLGAPVP